MGMRNSPQEPEYAVLVEVWKETRAAAGLTQRQLAAKLSKSASHVCMIDRRQRSIDVLEFYRLAVACGQDAPELFRAVDLRLRSRPVAHVQD
jgi:transcriptional regulator with XRE-family HTH domain